MKDEATFLPKAIAIGTKVQLINRSFKDIEIREWEFSGVEKGEVVLHRPEGLILKVKLEDIDWRAYRKSIIED